MGAFKGVILTLFPGGLWLMEAINYLQLEVNYLQLLNICLQIVILIGKVHILKCFNNICRTALLIYCHLAVLMTVLFL